MKTLFHRLISYIIIFSLAGLPFTAQAGLIGTDEAVSQTQLQTDRAKVSDFVSRADVQQQLQQFGLTQQNAKDRVDALTEAEVQHIAGKIDASNEELLAFIDAECEINFACHLVRFEAWLGAAPNCRQWERRADKAIDDCSQVLGACRVARDERAGSVDAGDHDFDDVATLACPWARRMTAATSRSAAGKPPVPRRGITR